MKSNTFSLSKKMTVANLTRAAILTSLGLALNLILIISIPVAGFSAIKLTFSPAVVMITGIICGPFAGFASGAIIDLFTATIRPIGAYVPIFTIVAGLPGFFSWFFYRLFKSRNLNYDVINAVFILLLSFGCVLGVASKELLTFEQNWIYYSGQPINIIFIIGFIVLVCAFIAIPKIITSKFNLNTKTNKILTIVSISQILTSILINTYFISAIYGIDIIVLLPFRVITNFVTIPIYTIVVSVILETLDKRFKLNISDK